MRNTISLIIAAQAFIFNVLAEPHHNNTENLQPNVEDLRQAESNTITTYHWTKDVHASRNARTFSYAPISPLVYAHSSPVIVMPTLNTTPIFWGSAWAAANTAFISDKIAGLTYFYSNLHGSSYLKTVAEYLPNSSAVNHNLITVKTDSSTTSSSSTGAVLAEVCKVIGANHVDPNGYYPVYSDQARGNATFCAYHSAGLCSVGGPTVQFAFFFNLNNDPSCDPQSPYAPASGSTGAQAPLFITGGGTAPHTQSQGLAALVNVTAHELAETVTDPADFPPYGNPYWAGWYDLTGSEIGDKCAWTFGPSNVSGTQPGTVMIGAYDWKLQGEWSNKAYNSKTGYDSLQGCITGS